MVKALQAEFKLTESISSRQKKAPMSEMRKSCPGMTFVKPHTAFVYLLSCLSALGVTPPSPSRLQVNGIDTVRVPMDVVMFDRPRSRRYRSFLARQAAKERSAAEPPPEGSNTPESAAS